VARAQGNKWRLAMSRASNAVKAVVSKDGASVLTGPAEVLERLKEHYADLAAEVHQERTGPPR
jgi:hypothetical protein